MPEPTGARLIEGTHVLSMDESAPDGGGSVLVRESGTIEALMPGLGVPATARCLAAGIAPSFGSGDSVRARTRQMQLVPGARPRVTS